jgi:MerR family transcriptional regulator, light-induced transcriptional regulator
MEAVVFSIKDLENLSGIKAHTIRIWEQRYNFLKPRRTETNIRFYCNRELKTVLNVSLLCKYGYKISRINRMSDQEVTSKIITLSDKEAQLERLVNELIAFMIDFDIGHFEQALDGFILANGIDKAITRVVFPFLDRIGILWATGHVNAAQEHLITHVIRQKLIVGIEHTGMYTGSDKTVLLFLPEGEHHELGLLYVYYLLRKQGVNTLYLGADLTLKDLEFVCRHRRPDYLYTHLTNIAGSFSFEKFLFRVSQQIGVPLVVSGRPARSGLRKIPPGVDLRRSIPEVLGFIATL